MAEKNPSEQKPNETHTEKIEEKNHLNEKKPLQAFPEPLKKSKEDIKKAPPKEESDEEEEKEERDSEDYSTPHEEEEDVSIDYDGENTSEHSENFDLEDYLNFCSKHPVGDNSDEEEGLDKKKKKEGEEEDEIITSKDLKNKKLKK